MNYVLHAVTRQLVALLLLLPAIPGNLLANNYRNRTASTPEISITASNGGILTCTNTSVTLSATSTASNATFTWTGPGGFTASGPSAIATIQGTYMVTASSPNALNTASISVIQATAGNNTGFWKADFSQPDGTTSVDTGAYRWSSVHTGVSTTKFSVLNNEFRVNNSKQGKEGTWSSSVINITGRAPITISADVRSAVDAGSSLENDTTPQGDYIRMYYVLDNGAEVLFCEKKGNINNNSPVNTTVASELLSGSSLQVIIRSRASATDEYYYLDNIQLSTVVPLGITATASASQTLTCINTLVQLSGNADVPGAGFNWSGPGGFSSTQQNPTVHTAGTYTLQVIDPVSGCTGMASTTVAANTTPPGEISINNSGTITCLNRTVTISGSSSSTGVNYKWEGPNAYSATSSSATVTHGGIYTLTATNPVNGCTSGKSTTVAENTAAPVITIGNTSPLSCANAIVTLSASTTTPNASYLWIGEDLVEVAATITVGIAGIYIITVTNPANGCITTNQATVTEDYSDCLTRKTNTATSGQ